jgi:hypothetical protein
MSDPDPRWVEVAGVISRRVDQLGMSLTQFYEASGLSQATFLKMRRGIPLARPHKRVAAARALGWTPDSIDRLLVGEAPVLASADPVTYDDIAGLPAQVADLDKRVAWLEQRSVGDRGTATDEMTIVRAPQVDLYMSAKDADELEGVTQLPRTDPVEFLMQRQAELVAEVRELAAVVNDLTGVVKALQADRGSAEPGR